MASCWKNIGRARSRTEIVDDIKFGLVCIAIILVWICAKLHTMANNGGVKYYRALATFA